MITRKLPNPSSDFCAFTQAWWHPCPKSQRWEAIVIPGSDRHSTKLPAAQAGRAHLEGNNCRRGKWHIRSKSIQDAAILQFLFLSFYLINWFYYCRILCLCTTLDSTPNDFWISWQRQFSKRHHHVSLLDKFTICSLTSHLTIFILIFTVPILTLFWTLFLNVLEPSVPSIWSLFWSHPLITKVSNIIRLWWLQFLILKHHCSSFMISFSQIPPWTSGTSKLYVKQPILKLAYRFCQE